MLEIDKIYNMDCLEGMKQIEDNSIDMILCDLPYEQTSNEWDIKIPLDLLWKEYKRIIKERGTICLTAKGAFLFDLIKSNRKWFRYEWVWNKKKGANFTHITYRPLNVHEYILIYYKKIGTFNPQKTKGKPYKQKRLQSSIKGIADNLGKYTTDSNGMRYPKSIINIRGMAQRNIIHPTQKPLFLFEYLIKTYSNEGYIILDNCMGSGTTAVACKRLNRHFIGFEINKEYYDISLKRLLNVPERLEKWIDI